MRQIDKLNSIFVSICFCNMYFLCKNESLPMARKYLTYRHLRCRKYTTTYFNKSQKHIETKNNFINYESYVNLQS